MRFLHTSDWHLGRRLHGEDLLPDQARFLEWLRHLAVAERVDAVLVCGDVYDRAQPGADAIALLDHTIAAFARHHVPMVISSGNHDSAVRLAYAGPVLSQSGIHLRTSIDEVGEPVLFHDAAGRVGVYALPYVLPDAVAAELLEGDRSHEAVFRALTARIRDDARARDLSRIVVMAHAFVTGGLACASEREIRVGGVGDTPADVFDGFSYVALGHLHGPQAVTMPGSRGVARYSGSPLAFSFSERDHTKSVAVVDIDAEGAAAWRLVPTPVPRPLVQVRGRLDELLARAEHGDLPDLAGAWVKVVLTDPGRVAQPMQQLRGQWPHTIALEFDPDRGSEAPGLVRATQASDPVAICRQFVAAVAGAPPTPAQEAVLAEVVASTLRQELTA